MKLEFLFVVLLATGSNAGIDKSKLQDRFRDRGFRFPRFKIGCVETSTHPCTTSPATATTTSTTTVDPCANCRNAPISISDTFAGQCTPIFRDGKCECLCADVFCFDGKVIDRTTCTRNGSLQDCKCISTSTIAPTTVPPTKDPYAGCESCLNDKLSVGDTVAGQCYPQTSENECNCVCADIFCRNGQIIDRSTCVNGGSISKCKCIDTTTPRPTTTQTTIGF